MAINKRYRNSDSRIEKKGLLYSEPTETVVRQRQLTTAKGIMRVRSNLPLDVLVVSVASSTVYAPEDIVLGVSSDSMVNIIDLEQVGRERLYMVATMKTASISLFKSTNSTMPHTPENIGGLLSK